jgi:hypothetical protein
LIFEKLPKRTRDLLAMPERERKKVISGRKVTAARARNVTEMRARNRADGAVRVKVSGAKKSKSTAGTAASSLRVGKK